MLVSTHESKDTVKKYEKLWNRIRDFIRPVTKNSGNYDQKYMKIKFDLDDDLPLKKMLELHNMIVVVRSVFREGNKYYPNVFINYKY